MANFPECPHAHLVSDVVISPAFADEIAAQPDVLEGNGELLVHGSVVPLSRRPETPPRRACGPPSGRSLDARVLNVWGVATANTWQLPRSSGETAATLSKPGGPPYGGRPRRPQPP